MNNSALFIAIVGVAIVIAGFFAASKIEKKDIAIIAKLASGVGGFLSMAVFSVDPNTAYQAGSYWVYLIVIVAIINKIRKIWVTH